MSSLQYLKKKKKKRKKRLRSLLKMSSCLMAGFSARQQTSLLGENVQKPHMSGIRIKALKLLISRLAPDTTTASNAVTRERM